MDTTTEAAGYTGVTAAGAGSTGSAPAGGYAATVDDTATTYPGVTAYPVTGRTIRSSTAERDGRLCLRQEASHRRA